ncbi:MAG: hypothetical protein WCG27_10805, partial [Pseudomonadota bacterium]
MTSSVMDYTGPYSLFRMIVLAGVVSVSSQLFAANVGNFSYESYQRLSEASSGQAKNDNWFTFKINTGMAKTRVESYLDASFRVYFADNDYLYSVPQGYISWMDASQRWDFTVGRKILNWDPTEKFWQLSQLNGQQAFNLLSDEQEGPVGAQYNQTIGPVFFSLYTSYLYAPQLNPVIKVKDGKVSSKSSWEQMPPKRTLIMGKKVPIYYILEKPVINKIVFQRSLG